MLLGMRQQMLYPPAVQADFTTLDAYTTPSWLSFSRSGGAMMTDSTGKLTWAPNNFAQYSQDFRNTTDAGSTRPWAYVAIASVSQDDAGSVAPDGTQTAAKITEDTSTNSHYDAASTGTAIVEGRNYIVSAYFKNIDRQYVSLSLNSNSSSSIWASGVFDLVNGTYTTNGAGATIVAAGITSVGNGWWRCWVVGNFTAATANSQVLVAGASASSGATFRGTQIYAGTSKAFYVWGIQVEPVTYQNSPGPYLATTSSAVYLPRYDFDASTTPATPRGLLIEESRTNLVVGLSSWNATNCSFTGTSITGPDGTSVSPLTVTTTAATTFNKGTASAGSASGNSYSIYVKKGSGATEANGFAIYNNTTAATVLGITFNYDTGAITYTTGASGASAQNVGNGWWRLVLSATTGISAGNTLSCYACFLGGSANAGAYAYLWGAQLEAGSFATSYIPTTSASVTRAADVAQLTGSALTVAGANTGSAICQTSLVEGVSASVSQFILESNTNRRLIFIAPGSTNTVTSRDSSTQLIATVGNSATWTTAPIRSAIGWSAAGRSLAANNGTVVSDAINLGTDTVAYLGNFNGSTNQICGWVSSLALYNTRLPDAVLKQKSSVGAPY